MAACKLVTPASAAVCALPDHRHLAYVSVPRRPAASTITGIGYKRNRTMSLYEIAFSGQLLPGAKLEQVEANLTKLFQADAQRIALLFSGRHIVIKPTLDFAADEKYPQARPRARPQVELTPLPAHVEEHE